MSAEEQAERIEQPVPEEAERETRHVAGRGGRSDADPRPRARQPQAADVASSASTTTSSSRGGGTSRTSTRSCAWRSTTTRGCTSRSSRTSRSSSCASSRSTASSRRWCATTADGSDDSEVVVTLGALLHCVGMAVHREGHEDFSLFLAEPKMRELLDGLYEEPDLTVICPRCCRRSPATATTASR